jgi:hypothetical protein
VREQYAAARKVAKTRTSRKLATKYDELRLRAIAAQRAALQRPRARTRVVKIVSPRTVKVGLRAVAGMNFGSQVRWRYGVAWVLQHHGSAARAERLWQMKPQQS